MKIFEIREYYVVKANDLIQKSRYELSLQEQRIILYLISKIKPEDKEFDWHEFKIQDFCNVCGIDNKSGTNYKNIKDTIKTLADKSWWIPSKDERNKEGESLVRWIDNAKIFRDSGTIRIKLHDEMKPYLLQLRKRYTQYRLYYTLAMQSKYSVRLYEILKSYSWQNDKIIPLDELKEMLSATNYSLYKDFRKNVIELALKEINKLTDIKVSYAPIKEGRKFIKIEFVIELKEDMDERFEIFDNVEKIISKKQGSV